MSTIKRTNVRKHLRAKPTGGKTIVRNHKRLSLKNKDKINLERNSRKPKNISINEIILYLKRNFRNKDENDIEIFIPRGRYGNDSFGSNVNVIFEYDGKTFSGSSSNADGDDWDTEQEFREHLNEYPNSILRGWESI